jgi:hypothetical protein
MLVRWSSEFLKPRVLLPHGLIYLVVHTHHVGPKGETFG